MKKRACTMILVVLILLSVPIMGVFGKQNKKAARAAGSRASETVSIHVEDFKTNQAKFPNAAELATEVDKYSDLLVRPADHHHFLGTIENDGLDRLGLVAVTDHGGTYALEVILYSRPKEISSEKVQKISYRTTCVLILRYYQNSTEFFVRAMATTTWTSKTDDLTKEFRDAQAAAVTFAFRDLEKQRAKWERRLANLIH